MLTNGIKAKLVLFVVGGLLATTYLGAKYVGLDRFTGDGYEVSVALPDAAGLFENGEVTYRGVPVGRITHLEPTTNGMVARLRIDGDAPPIPSSSTVAVANRSTIGEQYLDFRAESAGGEPLKDGAEVTGSGDSLPPDLFEVLRSGRDFAASVPEEDLGTVIDEAYDATRGASEHVRRLVETSHDYVRTADRNFLVTQQLIENASTVLTTQEESSRHLLNYSRDFALVAETMAESDGDLRELIANSPAAARELQQLFESVGTPLGVLMANLVTPAQVFGVNSAGVEDALIRVPEAVSVGWAINGSKGVSMSLAQTYFNPTPCTSGYGGTTVRDGLTTTTGTPLNLAAGCTSRDAATNVRGPKAATKSKAAAANVTTATSLDDLFGGR